MLNFYRAIKDSSNYLRQAASFFDSNYMRVSVDSAKKGHKKYLDSIKRIPAMAELKPDQLDTSRLVFSQVSISNSMPMILNNAAWDFYLTGTKNRVYLLKALSWSQRSLAIEPSYHAYDTKAHLNYQLELYAEAERDQREAIRLAKQKKAHLRTIKNLETVLKKIKSRNI